MQNRYPTGPNYVDEEPRDSLMAPGSRSLGALKATIVGGAGLVAGSIALHGLLKHNGMAAKATADKLREDLAKVSQNAAQRAAAKGRLGTTLGVRKELRVVEHEYKAPPLGQWPVGEDGQQRRILKRVDKKTDPVFNENRVLTKPPTAATKRIGADRSNYVLPKGAEWENHHVQAAVLSQRQVVARQEFKDSAGRLTPDAREVIRAEIAARKKTGGMAARRGAAKAEADTLRNPGQVHRINRKKAAKKGIQLERILTVIREFGNKRHDHQGEFASPDDDPHPQMMQEAYHKPFLKKAAVAAGFGIGAAVAAHKFVKPALDHAIQSEGLKIAHEKLAKRFVEGAGDAAYRRKLDFGMPGKSGSEYFRNKAMGKLSTRARNDPSLEESAMNRMADEHADKVIRRYQKIKLTNEAIGNAQAKKRVGVPFTDRDRQRAAQGVSAQYEKQPTNRDLLNKILKHKGTLAIGAAGAGVGVAATKRDEGLPPNDLDKQREYRKHLHDILSDSTHVPSAEEKRALEGERTARNQRLQTGVTVKNLKDQIWTQGSLLKTARKIATGELASDEKKMPVILGPDGTIAREKTRVKAAQLKVGRMGFTKVVPSSIPTHEEAAAMAHRENAEKAAAGRMFTPATSESIRARSVGGGDKLPSPSKLNDAAMAQLKKHMDQSGKGLKQRIREREKEAKRVANERRRGLHKSISGVGETYLDPGHAKDYHAAPRKSINRRGGGQ